MLPFTIRTGAARVARPMLPRSTGLTTSIITRRASSTEPHTNHPARDMFSRFARLDPKLYGILAVTVGVVSAFAYYFAGNPTTASDSRHVSTVPDSEPWHAEGSSGKYKYYPRGDVRMPPREAPSALNVTVIPNVDLPKELHDKYNKWGKPEWEG